MRNTFHFVGLPTTETNDDFSGCPYTTGAKNLIQAIVDDGDTVFHYCNHGSDTAGEDIYVTPENFLGQLGKSHRTQYHSAQKPAILGKLNKTFSMACATHIRNIINPGDFVLLPSDGTGDVIGHLEDIEGIKIVETEVGYNDPVSPFRIFPTQTWRSFWRGRSDRAEEIYKMFEGQPPHMAYNPNVMVSVAEPRWVFDTVIHSIINPDNFKPCEDKEDYFLFLGRIIVSKGIQEAIELTEHLGKKLIVAGPGTFEHEFGKDFKLPKHVEFVGMANNEKRADLLSKAECLLALTRYNEPCGFIVSEAGFSQKPVITSNSGGFTETVTEGVNGFRGDCMAEWVEKAERLGELDSDAILKHAHDNFSAEALYPKYKAFWRRINGYFENEMDINFSYQ